MSVSRFGVSLEKELLIALDEYVKLNQFANRSQAIRYLIEKNLIEEKWKCDNMVAGAIVLVYPFQKLDVKLKIAELFFQNKDIVLSSQNMFLSEINCLEIVAVKGPSHRLTELSDKLISLKGVQHGKLVMSKSD